MESAQDQASQLETQTVAKLTTLANELQLALEEMENSHNISCNANSSETEKLKARDTYESNRKVTELHQEEIRTILKAQCDKYRIDFLAKFPRFSELKMQIKQEDNTDGTVAILIYFEKAIGINNSLSFAEIEKIMNSCPSGFEAKLGEAIVPNIQSGYGGANVPKACIRYVLPTNRFSDPTNIALQTRDLTGKVTKI